VPLRLVPLRLVFKESGLCADSTDSLCLYEFSLPVNSLFMTLPDL